MTEAKGNMIEARSGAWARRRKSLMMAAVGMLVGLALGFIFGPLLLLMSLQSNLRGLQGGSDGGPLLDGVMYAPERAHVVCIAVGAALGGIVGAILGRWGGRRATRAVAAPDEAGWPPPPTPPAA